MRWQDEWKWLVCGAAAFLAVFFLPVGTPRFDGVLTAALQLPKRYAREHVMLCLLPAFFIAGAITVFVSQDAVLKHLGDGAPKAVSYGVASVSGSILAVCSGCGSRGLPPRHRSARPGPARRDTSRSVHLNRQPPPCVMRTT